LDCGDAALSVDFGNVIDPVVNARVMALDRALTAAAVPGVIECVPTYRALMVHFDPVTTDHDALCATIRRLVTHAYEADAPARRWRVPVAYGGDHGIDLDSMATHAGLSPAAFIEAHAAPVYRVMMIGFLPGFAYLGGLPPALARSRRDTPRPRIPPASISIGGAQTAIGSVEGPSGWHLIGRTPALSFVPDRDPVFLFGPGDEIVFAPISVAEYDRLAARAAAGDLIAERLA
ncbi:MAG TPA: 5-oxoprolinase subunit PxpB, partial [Paracoccaceae bacterium]|nr:5-oxoprolinase subunit PxpB [Paracoccaceae bacterium]